ncbi:MAG: hypothetical protein QM270_06625 [Bacillota bacterium]|nr:hypothetical protein [Bacillota bacterium]
MGYPDGTYITQRLRSRLSRIDSRPITTVIAPMGYGKTTAIKWWSTRRTKSHEAALFFRQIIMTDSITDFWTGFCRLFRDFPDVYEQLMKLAYPRDLRMLLMCSEILYSSLAKLEKNLYFIFDDLHVLPAKVITQIVLFFARDMPENIHIVLISRNQIFNQEERMRLGNMLGEISTADLSLSRDELHDYAKWCGVEAASDEIDTLARLSEGWFSIVYLNFVFYEKTGGGSRVLPTFSA